MRDEKKPGILLDILGEFPGQFPWSECGSFGGVESHSERKADGKVFALSSDALKASIP